MVLLRLYRAKSPRRIEGSMRPPSIIAFTSSRSCVKPRSIFEIEARLGEDGAGEDAR